jgi:hypothetical protein
VLSSSKILKVYDFEKTAHAVYRFFSSVAITKFRESPFLILESLRPPANPHGTARLLRDGLTYNRTTMTVYMDICLATVVTTVIGRAVTGTVCSDPY